MGKAVDITLFVVEFVIMLVCIALGSRFGGMAIGFFGAVGVAIFGFGFQIEPGPIAWDVIQIIIAAITIISTVQVAGGLDYLVAGIERFLRRAPKAIVFLAPCVTYLLSVAAGTGHTSYSVMPVIIDVAKGTGIRPSRALSVAVVAAQTALVASPISALMVFFAERIEEERGVPYLRLLATTIPSTFLGAMVTAVVCCFLGKDLYKDPRFLKRVADGSCRLNKPLPPEVQARVNEYRHELEYSKDQVSNSPSFDTGKGDLSFVSTGSSFETFFANYASQPTPKASRWQAKVSIWLFLFSIVAVVVYAILISKSVALFEPVVNRDLAIVSFLPSMAAIICLICGCRPQEVAQSSTFKAGMTGCICVLGVAWMGSTFIEHHLESINSVIGDVLRDQPWTLAIILFLAGAIMYSPAATARPLIPVAFTAGVSSPAIVACLPAVASLFVLPTYPTLLAASLLDDTGSTKIGSWVFNHSMFIPQIVCIVATVAIGFGFAYLII